MRDGNAYVQGVYSLCPAPLGDEIIRASLPNISIVHGESAVPG